MGDYVNADTVDGHPLSGSGQNIPNPLENQFYSGSDKFDYGITAPGGLNDAGGDSRISWTDGTDTIFKDEDGNAVMYVDTGKKIGILNDSPPKELTVQGEISASGEFYSNTNRLLKSSDTGSMVSLTVGGTLAPSAISSSGAVTLTLSTTEILTTGSLWVSGSGDGDASGSGYLMIFTG